MNVTGKEVGRR